MFFRFLTLWLFVSALLPALAGEADIVKVKASQGSKGKWTFHVTVRHGDTGWEHFANRWEVLSTEREILETRVLAHPHEHEQPFTRSLSGIALPKGTKAVIIRAHDSQHNYGGKEILYRLP